MAATEAAPALRAVARLAVSGDALTCVDLVRDDATTRSFVDKHTLMSSSQAASAAALNELDVLLTLQPVAAASGLVALRSFRLDAHTARLHVAIEHCARGDLFRIAQTESRLMQADLLAARQGLTTSERALRRVACQTLRGLRTLHAHDIAHTDLSLENVFLTARGDVRIGDFALARRVQRDGHSVVAPGAAVAKPAYAAPELHAGGTIDDLTKADVWSLGVMLWHLVTRTPLFPTGAATPQDAVFRAMVQSTSWANKLLPSGTASPALRDLLVRLLDPNPSTRLSADAALHHAWFASTKRKPPTVAVISTALSLSKKTQQEDESKSPPCGRGRTASAEISLDATRVPIRPSSLRRP